MDIHDRLIRVPPLQNYEVIYKDHVPVDVDTVKMLINFKLAVIRCLVNATRS